MKNLINIVRQGHNVGTLATYVWVKSEGADRASMAQSITPFTISGKESYQYCKAGSQCGSSIHPRLGEVRRGRQSIAGSKHNSLYHFWQRLVVPSGRLKDYRLTRLREEEEARKLLFYLKSEEERPTRLREEEEARKRVKVVVVVVVVGKPSSYSDTADTITECSSPSLLPLHFAPLLSSMHVHYVHARLPSLPPKPGTETDRRDESENERKEGGERGNLGFLLSSLLVASLRG
ncbi:hypothetical protein BHM03_00032262 [Ensete ventricosum]|nr:hypothetical protein BHM03_00032262 [Ensete ventricosum]